MCLQNVVFGGERVFENKCCINENIIDNLRFLEFFMNYYLCFGFIKSVCLFFQKYKYGFFKIILVFK